MLGPGEDSQSHHFPIGGISARIQLRLQGQTPRPLTMQDATELVRLAKATNLLSEITRAASSLLRR